MDRVSKYKGYKKRDAASLTGRTTRSNRDSFKKDEYSHFTPKDGLNIIRVAPPTYSEEQTHWGYDIYVHYSIGLDKGAYICLYKHNLGRCPICEERARAEDEGDIEYSKTLKYTRRVLMWVIDRKNEKDGPKIWATPKTVDDDLSMACVDPLTKKVLPMDHPEEGYDASFTKTGTGFSTKYTGVSIARDSSSFGSDESFNFIVDNPLDKCIMIHDYEYILSKFTVGGPKIETLAEEVSSATPITETIEPINLNVDEPTEVKKAVDLSYETLKDMDEDAILEILEDTDLTTAQFDSVENTSNKDELVEVACGILWITIPKAEPETTKRRSLKKKAPIDSTKEATEAPKKLTRAEQLKNKFNK